MDITVNGAVGVFTGLRRFSSFYWSWHACLSRLFRLNQSEPSVFLKGGNGMRKWSSMVFVS